MNMETIVREKLTLPRMQKMEADWQQMEAELYSSVHPRCADCEGADTDIPLLLDGRKFCCAITDILECSEKAVSFSEIEEIAAWSGVRINNLRDAHEGYISQAVIILPYEKSPLPKSFYPFPEDKEMVETPKEREELMRKLRDSARKFL